ncbi:glutamate synthase large subunit [Denitromonas iodatirespirans]|uniref:Glutamate synthase large subunit n=1 Tax=Denitromonas iodatirespirans TaxID=2795389 RepID=A0A944D9P1_DENI1|nr:glutamate synthase large subunit [Denitromonas iodatirespirans]MBT0961111.1 glutamate synthase large subunit [Denitromonas iodatirespirans]
MHTHASCGVGALVDLSGHATHALVADGLQLLANLDHRSARGAEEESGDGAGILLQIPHTLYADEVADLPARGGYGLGQAFMPRDDGRRARVRRLVEVVCAARGFDLVAWREVPVDPGGLGRTAADSRPAVWQFFVAPRNPAVQAEALDLQLYVLRRALERDADLHGLAGAGRELFYLCSLDRRTVVYKGLLTCPQLARFYPDLTDARTASALALLHARFSTNTLGAWQLAHPYRCLVHNGEINTLRGNLNWLRAHEAEMASERLGADIDTVLPVTGEGLSDSAVFDHVLELLVMTGRSLPHALRMMVPEAWQHDRTMDPARRDFYAWHAALMEPWDGPALVVATDGTQLAAILDRNGLRPCRYCLTRDRRLILASETGVLDTAAADIVHQGRLRPGQLFLADTTHGRIVPEDEIFATLAAPPYGAWLRTYQLRLGALARNVAPRPVEPPAQLARLQHTFGYTEELLHALLEKMAEGGKDPIGSMGDDTPPALLSARHRPLFAYFKQEFAQVSNPPLDYIREALVTSLAAPVGRHRNLLDTAPAHCRQLLLESPILADADLAALEALIAAPRNGIRACRVDITFAPEQALRDAIERVRADCSAAIEAGGEVLILDDRAAGPERLPIPSLLATGAVHHHLIRAGLRRRVALVLVAGEPAAVHPVCTLLGYGADAVYPWLAYRSLAVMASAGPLARVRDPQAAYRAALEGGLLKVMAKMGISTLASYKGAQIFEAIGLAQDFVDEYFTGTACALPAAGLELFEREARERHAAAWAEAPAGNAPLSAGGELYWRRDGEHHQWNPYTIGKLQQAAREADADAYRDFAAAVDGSPEAPATVRALLDFVPATDGGVPLAEVEPAAAILARFGTGSMSFGSLSREVHETLAVAMNRLGGSSGTGEGGEQVERFGTERACSMKQVASGRFGVTAQYLAEARQIEIKMAQGAKPGEGGELPGGKVDAGIAEVRFTVPGIGLISPPPHHDIYSIEDLAQLIHDLKCANPAAEIHVKLVAKAGVGTIAAGVAKARADAVLISGDAGGTGASVKTSIKGAGSGWELGLADTHRALMANRLRSRIRVRADGGFLTGRDVVVAALLGAEEYGFGTAALVALGCIMLRKCHCNTCSVGIATQDPELRRRFAGAPEHVMNYLGFVAEEVRTWMARLGFRSMDEMIGRVDCLNARALAHPKGLAVDVSALLAPVAGEDTSRRTRTQDHKLGEQIDHALIGPMLAALDRGERYAHRLAISNRDRTFGTLLSHEITRRHGAKGLPAETVRLDCHGHAGQSFGAFLCPGIHLQLTGDANDHVGKGLSGGRIVIATPADAGYPAAGNIIVGNVALYGATAGEAYINGQAGERFAVRNSGAQAVVEGAGDHACEYMTGGTVVFLGPLGRNFGAGMSGGVAYLLDTDPQLRLRLADSALCAELPDEARDHPRLQRLLAAHVAHTGSALARALLADWTAAAERFLKIIPAAYAALTEARPAPPAPAPAPSENHPDGYRRYPRIPIAYRAPDERIGDHREIYAPNWDAGALLVQGERCMDCGVPACMAGCPIGNRIPEWNDLVARGDWHTALARLHATNNFPEFTGYACPAPCEPACTLAIGGEAVTIKSIERAIVDRGWAEGWIVPQPPAERSGRRVAVVGSGPAGLAAAQQLNRAGHHVTVFERDDAIGGLLTYGIPDFKLAKARVARRVEQLAAEGVRFRTGVTVGTDLPLDRLRREYDAVCLALGALAPREVEAPGRTLGGVHLGLPYLIAENRRQAGRPAAPLDAHGRRVLVLGGGDTGADCVATAHRQGAAQVTQVSIHPRPPDERPPGNPWPAWPQSFEPTYALTEGGRAVFGLNSVEFLDADGDGEVDAVRFERVRWQRDAAGRRTAKEVLERGIRLDAELVLIAAGFAGPDLAPFAADGLTPDAHGRLAADAAMMSPLPGVFVAGDARRGPSLIVWAIGEGRDAARAIDRYLAGTSRLPASLATANPPLAARGL